VECSEWNVQSGVFRVGCSEWSVQSGVQHVLSQTVFQVTCVGALNILYKAQKLRWDSKVEVRQ